MRLLGFLGISGNPIGMLDFTSTKSAKCLGFQVKQSVAGSKTILFKIFMGEFLKVAGYVKLSKFVLFDRF